MSDLFALFIIIVAIGLFVALIVYITRRFRTSKKHRMLGKGWYFISKRQTPHWLRRKWRDSGIDWSHGTVTEIVAEARGNHYEYRLVVVDSGHTHDNAVIRRRLRRHRR